MSTIIAPVAHAIADACRAVNLDDKPKSAIACAECGMKFTPVKSWQQFCCKAHKAAYGNRHAAEGKVIAALVKAWRLKRGTGAVAKEAFAELCSIVDSFNADDRVAGRPPATHYVERLLKQGRYIDRKRN